MKYKLIFFSLSEIMEIFRNIWKYWKLYLNNLFY